MFDGNYVNVRGNSSRNGIHNGTYIRDNGNHHTSYIVTSVLVLDEIVAEFC